MKLFEAIGRNDLHDVIEAIQDGCDVDEYKSASFVYQKTKIKIYRDVITEIITDLGIINGCLDLNFTPLMCTLIFPSIDKEIIKTIIKAGADVDYCPEFYNTLLLFGLDRKCQNYALVELISHGANVNQCDEDGVSPLMHAIRNNFGNEVIEKLLLFGADVNSLCSVGRKPLMFVSCAIKVKGLYFCKSTYSCIDTCKNRKNVTSLINYGADVNSTDSEGNSVLHLHLCPDLINLLFSCGGRLDVRNNKGLTPLMLSISRVEYEIFKTLLSLGADPNCYDNDFNTPLQKSTKEIFASLLIYYGADINAATRNQAWKSLICDESFYLGIIAVVKYFLITENENSINSMVANDQADWLCLFIKKCKAEINRMKVMFIIDKKLTFYDFCVLKILKNNKFVDLSEKEYSLAFLKVDMFFNNFNEFIKLRLHDNKCEKYKFGLIRKFHKLTIAPCDSNGNGDLCYLNYDCLFELCRKNLTCKEVYNVFLASLL